MDAVRVGSDKTVVVARFELVAVALKRLDIDNSEIARSGLEDVSECESGKRRVAARACSSNNQAIGIGLVDSDDILRRVYAVVNIHDSPLTIQAFAVLAPIAGAASIVHIKHSESAAGPILNSQSQACSGSAGRAAMTYDDQGRSFSFRRSVSGVRRRIKESISSLVAFGRKINCLRRRYVSAVESNINGAPQDLARPGFGIEFNYREWF